MASSTHPTPRTTLSSTYTASDPSTPNTTFVQADPSTFRALVQQLTGASEDPSVHKLPLTLPSRLTSQIPKQPTFKLHERRQTDKKFELSIGMAGRLHCTSFSPNLSPSSSSSRYVRNRGSGTGFVCFGNEMVMASPASPLELLAPGSVRTPSSPQEEEDQAIADRGFYLHPSPRTPRKFDPPELLPLFPLHSPRQNQTY